jgi:hypothetical protein
VPRTLRSAISAVTRVFDALWRCAADPGSMMDPYLWVSALRSSVPDDASHRRENAAPRPGHEMHRFTPSQDEVVYFAASSAETKAATASIMTGSSARSG